LQYTIISDIGTKSSWGDILCAHAAVLETGDRFDFSAGPRSGLPGMDHYLALLALPRKIVEHNFLGYDARCLVKRLNAKIDFGKICDTLTASRLARPFRPIVRRALSQQP